MDTDKIKMEMETKAKEIEPILKKLKKDFETLMNEEGISDTRKEVLEISAKSMDTYAGIIKSLVDGV